MLLEMELCTTALKARFSSLVKTSPELLSTFTYFITSYFSWIKFFFLMFYRKEHRISQTEQYRKIQLYSRDSRWSFTQSWYMKRSIWKVKSTKRSFTVFTYYILQAQTSQLYPCGTSNISHRKTEEWISKKEQNCAISTNQDIPYLNALNICIFFPAPLHASYIILEVFCLLV